MIDTCVPLRRFARSPVDHPRTTPLLGWKEEWYGGAGRGVVAGLLDTSFDARIPDFAGADLVVRTFSGSEKGRPETVEHGTFSVATLIGQGHNRIRGIVPQASLFVAQVVGPDGTATPRAVIEALDWLFASGVQIVALPLGEAIERAEIAKQIERSSERGVVFFAAAGNGHPDPLVFPARHPLAIAVGAANVRGELLPECSRRPRLDIVAPGWKIPAPIRGRLVRRRGGSSVACVIAAGVAILALSAGALTARSLSRLNVLATLCRDGSARAPPSLTSSPLEARS